MSYNPVRAATSGKNMRRRPQPDAHAGVKHSDIVRAKGVGMLAPETGARDRHAHGFAVPMFASKSFAVRHEVMYEGNNSGIGVNKTDDRMILVRKGVLFVQVEDATGAVTNQTVQEGGYFAAKAGVPHGLASTGNAGCEFLVVETPNYAAGWQQLSAPIVGQGLAAVIHPGLPQAPPRRTDTKAYVQATEAAVAVNRGRRAPQPRPGADNPNSGNSVGVNLRPMGPPADTE